MGGETAILSTNTDITARHEAQEATKASELLYRSILDSMMDVYYRSDKDGRLVMVSPSMKDLLGYDVAESIGMEIADLYVEPEGPDQFTAALKASNGNLRGYEVQLRHKDGHVVWVSGNGQFCYDENNTVIGLDGTVRDITERRQLEQALRDSESQFRGLFENTKVGIAIRRGEKIVFANQAVAQQFGYDTPSDLTALASITEILSEEERARFRQIYEQRDRGEAPEYSEFRGLHKDGSTIWIEQWVQRITWEGGPAYLAFSMNITNRKVVEDHLKTAQRLETIGKLAGGVAHEFNNLLTVVTGNLEFAEDIIENHAAGRYVERAKNSALRGADLTHQLLAYSRRQPLQPVAVSADEVLQRAVAMMLPTLSGQIDIELVVADRLWDIFVDPGRLEDALLNLAINARDASPTGGTVRIGGSNIQFNEGQRDQHDSLPAGKYVAIRVTDSGTGMDLNVAERAFEPFFTTKDIGQGTGLGLSMVYGFAKQSGGDVDIETAVGQGTSVTLYLPRADGTERTASLADTEDIFPTGSGTILVVEETPKSGNLPRIWSDRSGIRSSPPKTRKPVWQSSNPIAGWICCSLIS
ncbi:MAG: PAS domain S-box protein [Alphaproteobacteria bacterium]